MVFVEKERGNLPFCNGSSLKNSNIEISLSPDVAFRLERIAEKENKTLEKFLADLILKESEKAFESNKGSYKKYFE